MTLEDYTTGKYTTPIKRIRQCGWEWAADEEAHWFKDRTLDEVKAAFKELQDRMRDGKYMV